MCGFSQALGKVDVGNECPAQRGVSSYPVAPSVVCRDLVPAFASVPSRSSTQWHKRRQSSPHRQAWTRQLIHLLADKDVFSTSELLTREAPLASDLT